MNVACAHALAAHEKRKESFGIGSGPLDEHFPF